jgi:hypothetical protein
MDLGLDHLTSATASERNPSSLENPHELPVVLTTRTVPVLKRAPNSAYRPLTQQFFIRPSTGWPKFAEFKWLQTIAVSPDQIRICNPRLPGFACYSITFRLSLCPFLRRTSRTKRLSGSVAHFPEDMAAVSDNPEPKLFIY